MEEAPNCAICNAPAYPECPCESERLQLAVKQAEHRAMEAKMADIRDWVIAHARQHVLNAFERLTSVRKQAHVAYLNSLPNYEIFMRYSGHPPIHHMFISQLNSQIAEAHAELKRGIDADWRASVLRYPEVLDYFYSLIEFRFPSDRSPSVAEPPFALAGYADRGYSGDSRLSVERKKRSRREGSVPHDKALSRLMRGSGVIPAPTPPLQHGPYRPPAFY